MRLLALALAVDAAILVALGGVVACLSAFRLKLVQGVPPYDVTTDIFQWASAIPGEPGHAVVDRHGVTLSPSHLALLAACVLLCADVSGGVLSWVLVCCGVLDSSWRTLPVAFLMVGLVVVAAVLPAVGKVRELHGWADQRSQFFEMVRVYLSELYGGTPECDDALRLVVYVCGLLSDKEFDAIMDTAELFDTELALYELFQAAKGKQVNGANWLLQLGPDDLELYKELVTAIK